MSAGVTILVAGLGAGRAGVLVRAVVGGCGVAWATAGVLTACGYGAGLWPWLVAWRGWTLVVGGAGDAGALLGMLVVVSSAVLVWAAWYTGADGAGLRLGWLLGAFTAGMGLVFVAADLVGLFLGWEVIGVASVLLVGHYTSRAQAGLAGLKAAV